MYIRMIGRIRATIYLYQFITTYVPLQINGETDTVIKRISIQTMGL